MELSFKTIYSPIGVLTLYADRVGLRAIEWPKEQRKALKLPKAIELNEHPILLRTEKQLSEYFTGRRTHFDIELSMEGTDFQKRVWKELQRIPFGETRSYGELAREIKSPKAARAVGAANGRNPLSIIVPCHRVVGASGSLTGFAGGLEVKQSLLNHEANFLTLA